MRLALAAALALLAACGTDPADDLGPDAVQHQAMTIDVMPLCQTYTWEAKVGQVVRERVVNRIAVFPNVGPDTAYSIQTCRAQSQLVVVYACPAGMACTGMQSPPGSTCARTHRGGAFLDGRLAIVCGTIRQSFDASGAESSRSETSFDSIQLTTY
jgi:hypothetical protein